MDPSTPPVVDGADISLTWMASLDGGGADEVQYDIYAAQLNVNVPVFWRVGSGVTANGKSIVLFIHVHVFIG